MIPVRVFVDISEVKRMIIHRVLVHSRRGPPIDSPSYAQLWLESASSSSSSSSSFNSEYLGGDGAMAASFTALL